MMERATARSRAVIKATREQALCSHVEGQRPIYPLVDEERKLAKT